MKTASGHSDLESQRQRVQMWVLYTPSSLCLFLSACLPVYFLTRSLTGMEITKEARLTVPQASGTHLSVLFYCWNYRHIPPHPASHVGSLETKLQISCLQSKHYADGATSPAFCLYKGSIMTFRTLSVISPCLNL